MATLTRRYRSQTLIAHVLLVLAVFLALPVEKPALWIMDMWGGGHAPPYLWPLLLGGLGLALLLVRAVTRAMWLMITAFAALATVGGAAYLSQGWNGLTVMTGVLMVHCIWTAIDLKAIARSQHGRV